MTKWKRRVVHHFVYKDVTKTTAIFKCRSRTRCRCRSEILTSLMCDSVRLTRSAYGGQKCSVSLMDVDIHSHVIEKRYSKCWCTIYE